MGQITVVGGASIDLPATLWNVDIRRASRTGPGYHDEAWERGEGYPPVFMRWDHTDEPGALHEAHR